MQNLLLGLQCMSVVLSALYAGALLKSFLCVKRDSVTRIFFALVFVSSVNFSWSQMIWLERLSNFLEYSHSYPNLQMTPRCIHSLEVVTPVMNTPWSPLKFLYSCWYLYTPQEVMIRCCVHHWKEDCQVHSFTTGESRLPAPVYPPLGSQYSPVFIHCRVETSRNIHHWGVKTLGVFITG